MGLLDGIVEFAGGATQGATQGLDLYQKFDQIKQEGEERERRKSVENQIIELSKSGGFKDPIEGSNKLAEIYLNAGFVEEGTKAAATARELTKARTTKQGLEAFSMVDADPFFATDSVNKFNESVGNPIRFEGTPMATGFQLRTIAPGGKVTEKIITDPDELRSMYGKLISPYLLDEDDPLKSRSEITKNEAAAEASKATSATQLAMAPFEQELAQARTGAAKAQAADAYASAASRGPEAALKKAETEARVKLLNAQTENQVNPRPEDPGILTAVGEFAGGFEPDLDGNLPDYAKPENLAPLATSLSTSMNLDSDAAVSRSAQLIQQAKQLMIDRTTNQVRLPGGEPIQLDAAGIDLLRRVGSAATPATAVP
jgi:hypothetical protein